MGQPSRERARERERELVLFLTESEAVGTSSPPLQVGEGVFFLDLPRLRIDADDVVSRYAKHNRVQLLFALYLPLAIIISNTC